MFFLVPLGATCGVSGTGPTECDIGTGFWSPWTVGSCSYRELGFVGCICWVGFLHLWFRDRHLFSEAFCFEWKEAYYWNCTVLMKAICTVPPPPPKTPNIPAPSVVFLDFLETWVLSWKGISSKVIILIKNSYKNIKKAKERWLLQVISLGKGQKSEYYKLQGSKKVLSCLPGQVDFHANLPNRQRLRQVNCWLSCKKVNLDMQATAVKVCNLEKMPIQLALNANFCT